MIEEESPLIEQSLEDKETILESIKERLVKMICDKVDPLRQSKYVDGKAFENVFNELM